MPPLPAGIRIGKKIVVFDFHQQKKNSVLRSLAKKELLRFFAIKLESYKTLTDWDAWSEVQI